MASFRKLSGEVCCSGAHLCGRCLELRAAERRAAAAAPVIRNFRCAQLYEPLDGWAAKMMPPLERAAIAAATGTSSVIPDAWSKALAERQAGAR